MRYLYNQQNKFGNCFILPNSIIEKYIRDITAFVNWTEGNELTKTLALEYKNMLTQQYAPASVNSVLSSLNGYFNYIERYDLKVKNLKVQRQIFCQSEKELTKAEYERLLKAAKSKKNERLYLIMQTICATGIRVSELKYVDVNSVMTGQAQVRLKGKIRMIILPRELCTLLKKYIKEKHITSGSVFVTRKGQPVDRHSIWKSMKQLCETAGVPVIIDNIVKTLHRIQAYTEQDEDDEEMEL